jgi:hypothetical protein
VNKVKPKKKLEIGNQHAPSTALFGDIPKLINKMSGLPEDYVAPKTPITKKPNSTKDKRLSISLDHLNLTELKTLKQKIKAKVKKTKKPFSQIITKQILS